MGLNIKFKLNNLQLAVDNNNSIPQGTVTQIKYDAKDAITGSIFNGKNQIPLNSYIKGINPNLILEGTACYGGSYSELNVGDHYFWYNPITKSIHYSTTLPSSLYDQNLGKKIKTFTSDVLTAKMYFFVQAGGGAGGGGYSYGLGGAGGGGGGGGAAVMSPVFLTTGKSDNDYFVHVRIGGGGSGNGQYGSSAWSRAGNGGDSYIEIYDLGPGGGVYKRIIAIAYGGQGGERGAAVGTYSGGTGGSYSVESPQTTHDNLGKKYIPSNLNPVTGFGVKGASGHNNNQGSGGSVGNYYTQLVDYVYMFNASVHSGYSGGGNNDTGDRSGGGGGASPNGIGGWSGKDRTLHGQPPASGYGGGGGGCSYKSLAGGIFAIGQEYMNGGSGAAGHGWYWL